MLSLSLSNCKNLLCPHSHIHRDSLFHISYHCHRKFCRYYPDHSDTPSRWYTKCESLDWMRIRVLSAISSLMVASETFTYQYTFCFLLSIYRSRALHDFVWNCLFLLSLPFARTQMIAHLNILFLIFALFTLRSISPMLSAFSIFLCSCPPTLRF